MGLQCQLLIQCLVRFFAASCSVTDAPLPGCRQSLSKRVVWPMESASSSTHFQLGTPRARQLWNCYALLQSVALLPFVLRMLVGFQERDGCWLSRPLLFATATRKRSSNLRTHRCSHIHATNTRPLLPLGVQLREEMPAVTMMTCQTTKAERPSYCRLIRLKHGWNCFANNIGSMPKPCAGFHRGNGSQR